MYESPTETGLYYLMSRYYDPEMGRFINADILISTGQGLIGNNVFIYCNNNPITLKDGIGAFPDLVVDIISLAFSVVDVISNPNDAGAWIGLAFDLVDVVVPFVGGLGEVAKAVDTAAEIGGAVKAAKNTANIADTSQDIAKTTAKTLNFDSTEILLKHFEKHKSQFGGLFSSADEYLSGANYVINNGQFVPELNGYIRFLGTGGRANYAFVGLKNAGKNISTFHVKNVKALAKIPALGFVY
ncbi:MAG: RHS repeat-associated core domain-containing protein [Clostridiales bacterium]|nr:RHS repeat-associated core domain-containing protein [Clostridiales bacterium]